MVGSCELLVWVVYTRLCESVNGAFGWAIIRVARDIHRCYDLLAVVAVVDGVGGGCIKPIARSRAASQFTMDVSPLTGVVTVAVVV